MMPFEVSIIRKRKKEEAIYVCPQTPRTHPHPPPPVRRFQWSNKWTAAGPLLGVAWGINEVAARSCNALLMKYKDTVLLTRAPTHSSSWHAEEAALLLLCRCVVFNGDKVNFSICQSALQPMPCALRNTIGSLSKAIHLNFLWCSVAPSRRVKGCHAAIKISSKVENESILKCLETCRFSGDGRLDMSTEANKDGGVFLFL